MHPNPFQPLVDLLSNILEAHTTAFFLANAKQRSFHLVAAQSLSRHLSENVTLPMEQSGILSQVHKAGQAIHLGKMHEITMALSSTLPFYREGESHIKGLLIQPVGHGDGVLYVDTKYSWGFNTKQQKWIKEIAELLHELVRQQDSALRQKSFDRIWQLFRRLNYVNHTGGTFQDYCQTLVHECAQFLGTEYGLMALKDVSGSTYHLFTATSNIPQAYFHRKFDIKQGLIGWIFRNQKPLFIPRLNSDSPEHYLLSSRESLPHHGTLWGLPAASTLGHSVVLAFLARDVMEWGAENRHAISHILYYAHLLLEQSYFKEEYAHVQTYDLSTGLLNNLAFEAKVEETLVTSMQKSVPCTLALLQLEPWQILHTRVPPKRIRKWQQQIAENFYRAVPSHVFVGQVAENRYGILLTELSPQEINQILKTLMAASQQFAPSGSKLAMIQPYLSTASFPQDVTSSEELWTLVYQRLFQAFPSTN